MTRIGISICWIHLGQSRKENGKGFVFWLYLVVIRWVFIGGKSWLDLLNMVAWLEVVFGQFHWDLYSNLQGKYQNRMRWQTTEREIDPYGDPSTDHASYLCRHHKAGRDVLYVELDLNDHNVIPNQFDRLPSCGLIDVHRLLSLQLCILTAVYT